MYFRILILLMAISAATSGCRRENSCDRFIKGIDTSFEKGNFTEMVMLSDSLKITCEEESSAILLADSLINISARIRLDFSYDRGQIIERIERLAGEVTDEDIKYWESKRWLEFRIIDGEKRYFNRAASNLMLLRGFYENREERLMAVNRDPRMISRLKHTESILNASGTDAEPVIPVDMIVTFTVTVYPDEVPPGEIVRCWIPWPKGSHPRQKPPEFISSSEQDYMISPDTSIHRSIYMEKKAEESMPVVFRVKYRYQSAGQYFNMNKIKVLPYNEASDIYRKYTSEQLPQICFTENVRRLADSIAGTDDDPVMTVRKFYLWFKEDIPWTGALEYSIMPNIPEYVITNRRGDCGMQTLLFMSMLRYKGIPVRWQSGWMVPPGSENLHDWCEIYFEGTGWVPADISYYLQNSFNRELKEFYISGIDSYRLIANDGIAGSFIPDKRFLRSDPYDFQRGEVEWKGGNLYYDQWDYEMEIEYLK